jgi:hypothetical protein
MIRASSNAAPITLADVATHTSRVLDLYGNCGILLLTRRTLPTIASVADGYQTNGFATAGISAGYIVSVHRYRPIGVCSDGPRRIAP